LGVPSFHFVGYYIHSLQRTDNRPFQDPNPHLKRRKILFILNILSILYYWTNARTTPTVAEGGFRGDTSETV